MFSDGHLRKYDSALFLLPPPCRPRRSCVTPQVGYVPGLDQDRRRVLDGPGEELGARHAFNNLPVCPKGPNPSLSVGIICAKMIFERFPTDRATHLLAGGLSEERDHVASEIIMGGRITECEVRAG